MGLPMIVRLLLFALPLGLDTFALSTVLGLTPMPCRTRLSLALTFAAAEGLMPAVGLLLGLSLGHALGGWSGLVAGALLIAVGAWMWRASRAEDDDDEDDDDDAARAGDVAAAKAPAGAAVDTHEKTVAGRPHETEEERIARAAHSTGWSRLGLALSVSLDELAIGFSFGVLGFPLVPALVVIALQALVVSLLGQWVGVRAGNRLGERAERLAGPALALLGVWFLIAQLVGLPF